MAGLSCGPAWAQPVSSEGERRVPVALVVANTAYSALPKLPFCELSANLVASALSRAGFKVLRQTNASNAKLGTAIASLGDDKAAATGARSLIYFCGYAVTYSDRLFLLPIEARLEREADVLSQGIVARLLMSSVAGPGSDAGLVMMDVAPPPGKGALEFASMLRPGDATHGGLVAAALPVAESQGPTPMAVALADMADTAGGGTLEVGAMLAGMQSQQALGRSLFVARPPAELSWLIGPAPEVPSAALVAVPALPVPAPISAAPAPFTPAAVTPVPGSIVSASTVSPLAEPNAAERRRVQLMLQKLGYFRGRITGRFGPDTVNAIRQLQRESDAETTGQLTVKQVEQLLK